MDSITVNTSIDLQIIILAVGLYLTIVYSARRLKQDGEQGTNERFNRVHSRIDNTNLNVAGIDKRVSVVESHMSGLAKHADVEALKSQMEKMQASQTRIEDFLMNNKGQ